MLYDQIIHIHFFLRADNLAFISASLLFKSWLVAPVADVSAYPLELAPMLWFIGAVVPLPILLSKPEELPTPPMVLLMFAPSRLVAALF